MKKCYLQASRFPSDLWRVNGVSLPASQPTSSFNWDVIKEHALKVGYGSYLGKDLAGGLRVKVMIGGFY